MLLNVSLNEQCTYYSLIELKISTFPFVSDTHRLRGQVKGELFSPCVYTN